MPPVLKVMEDNCKIISKDPAMSGFSKNTFVFTDVTYGLENNKRVIVTRTPDGTLSEAPFEVKKRAWQIYFPMKDRSFREPAMFEPDNLKRLLSEEEYEFVLDRACTQYEPYEQKFHDITSKVYLHLNDNLHFDHLRSTRHFGPMAFFFAWHKMIDNLLLDMIRNDYLKNGVQLVCLMYKLNDIKESVEILNKLRIDEELEDQIQATYKNLVSQEQHKKIEKSKEDLLIDGLCFEYIQDYVAKYSPKKPHLELALQTYKEWHNELKNIAAQSN
jgi:small subunit ribosomal protein S22